MCDTFIISVIFNEKLQACVCVCVVGKFFIHEKCSVDSREMCARHIIHEIIDVGTAVHKCM